MKIPLPNLVGNESTIPAKFLSRTLRKILCDLFLINKSPSSFRREIFKGKVYDVTANDFFITPRVNGRVLLLQ